MNKSVFIETILKSHDLLNYLKDQGFSPMRAYGHRYVYSCPLHGPETNPSFYVFTNKEFPYFHCFGCKAHGDVINLVSHLDNCSIKEAIGKLAHGLDIPYTDELEQIATDVSNERDKLLSVEDVVVKISISCRKYLEDVNFDKTEVLFFEQLFQKIDQRIHALDQKELNDIYDFLTSDKENTFGAIGLRMQEFQKREEEKARI